MGVSWDDLYWESLFQRFPDEQIMRVLMDQAHEEWRGILAANPHYVDKDSLQDPRRADGD